MTPAARPDPFPIEPLGGPLDADVTLPGSKSITNRALICAALAEGSSTLDGVLFADDTEAMLECLAQLGFALEIDRPGARVVVHGLGGRLPRDSAQLDARHSGTTARFLLPMLALGPGPYRLDGAEPLRARPMGTGFASLRSLGTRIDEVGQPGHLPVDLRRGDGSGGPPPVGEVRLDAQVSSQFASGLLLSAASRPTALMIRLDGEIVSAPYLDMTVAVMEAFGAEVRRPDERTYVVAPTGYRPCDYRVEPDASAASYFFAAAAILGGRVRVDGLGRSSLQGDLAFVDVLGQMGAEVERGSHHTEVRGTGALRGVIADFSQISDTAQTLAAVAVFADTPTEVTGIGFIRRKETDRLHAVVTELRRCGIDATETDDGFRIVPGDPEPAVIRTYDDHRMAMSFALLGLRAPGIAIAEPSCVAKTFPGYWDALDRLRTTTVSGQ
jgi:3-phosphoshikimate 1-carboxyvinyltransferase